MSGRNLKQTTLQHRVEKYSNANAGKPEKSSLMAYAEIKGYFGSAKGFING